MVFDSFYLLFSEELYISLFRFMGSLFLFYLEFIKYIFPDVFQSPQIPLPYQNYSDFLLSFLPHTSPLPSPPHFQSSSPSPLTYQNHPSSLSTFSTYYSHILIYLLAHYALIFLHTQLSLHLFIHWVTSNQLFPLHNIDPDRYLSITSVLGCPLEC